MFLEFYNCVLAEEVGQIEVMSSVMLACLCLHEMFWNSVLNCYDSFIVWFLSFDCLKVLLALINHHG